MPDERPEVATNVTDEAEAWADAAAAEAEASIPTATMHNVIAITVDDYAESLALQRETLELNQRSVAAYEDRAERAAASNERIAAALEEFVGLVRQALEAGDAR